jgi:hypothetical protein
MLAPIHSQQIILNSAFLAGCCELPLQPRAPHSSFGMYSETCGGSLSQLKFRNKHSQLRGTPPVRFTRATELEMLSSSRRSEATALAEC